MRTRFAFAAITATLTLLVPFSAAAEETEDPTTSPGASDTAPEELTEEQKLSPYVQPSVVFIEIVWDAWIYDPVFDEYLNDGQPFSAEFRCTGYVVNPRGWIATAGHCVEFDDDVDIALRTEGVSWALDNDIYEGVSEDAIYEHFANRVRLDGYATNDRKPDREVTVYWGATVSGIETEDGKVARVEDFQRFEQGDAALLKVDETNLNALPLVSPDTEVETLTPVAAVGFAGSVDEVTDADYVPSIKTGAISATRSRGGGLVTVYEIDAAVSQGMSGGPTVNYQGEVVGTNSFKPPDEDQPFNFVGQIARVHELLASNGVENELSQTTMDYRAGIDAYFAGDKEEAIRLLTAVTQEQPANGMASDYLSRARALPDPPPEPKEEEKDSSGLSTWVIVAIAAGALLLVGAIVLGIILARRRRRRAAAAATGGGVAPPPVGPYGPRPASPPGAAPSFGVPPGPAPTMQPSASPPQGPAAVTLVGGVSPASTDRPTSPITPGGPPHEHHDAKFCGECGEPASNGKFCRECGAPLGD